MKLYTCKTLPYHWVATDRNGILWIFPSHNNGWQSRTRYRGHRSALQPAANINAVGTGWGGAVRL